MGVLPVGILKNIKKKMIILTYQYPLLKKHRPGMQNLSSYTILQFNMISCTSLLCGRITPRAKLI